MAAQEEELGPVDIVVIGYPADAPMTGEAIPLLLDLVGHGRVSGIADDDDVDRAELLFLCCHCCLRSTVSGRR